MLKPNRFVHSISHGRTLTNALLHQDLDAAVRDLNRCVGEVVFCGEEKNGRSRVTAVVWAMLHDIDEHFLLTLLDRCAHFTHYDTDAEPPGNEMSTIFELIQSPKRKIYLSNAAVALLLQKPKLAAQLTIGEGLYSTNIKTGNWGELASILELEDALGEDTPTPITTTQFLRAFLPSNPAEPIRPHYAREFNHQLQLAEQASLVDYTLLAQDYCAITKAITLTPKIGKKLATAKIHLCTHAQQR